MKVYVHGAVGGCLAARLAEGGADLSVAPRLAAMAAHSRESVA